MFAPEFAQSISVKQFGADSQSIDFLRLLAIVCDYSKSNDSSTVMKGYKTKSEIYYELFISDTVNPDKASGIFKNINDVIPTADIELHMCRLKEECFKLSIQKEFSSIIDVDIYMFGLIYWVLICQKQLDDNKIEELKIKLNKRIREFKHDNSHTKSPASLKYLRKRITTSINSFRNYLV